jgi:hypothetical protein
MIEVVTTISLWELTKHTGTWIANLKRAKDSRKKQSIEALRKVITSSRQTAIYLRQLQEDIDRNIQKEGELSMLWTELGFELEDLGVKKLAKRCQIKGKHWENPQQSDKEYMKKADVSLERMERIAKEVLHEINS